MEILLQDWLSLLVRWLHIITAIAWIGSSFYFMWLDNSLRDYGTLEKGAGGENWSVHGGGFYHIQKFSVAPERMPSELHWFKWESYMTWISGFSLMAIIYYWGAESYLIDRSVMDLSPAAAIAISVASLALGWLIYDGLCRLPLHDSPAVLWLVLFAFIVLATYGFGQVFSARAAFLHIGAVIATIMSANVFMVIIPNQKKTVAALVAGETPDPALGRAAKLRSTHNNYLTLPVVFIMISNHYPVVFAHQLNWLVVALVLILGATVRGFFNARNAGRTGAGLRWQWPVAVATTLALVVLTAWRPGAAPVSGVRVVTDDALAIVRVHCVSCHAARPTDEAFTEAPGGIRLDSAVALKRHAAQVLAQTVLSDAMPLGNMTDMNAGERARLGAWIDAGMPDE